VSEAEQDKLKKAKKPVQNKMTVLELATGTIVTVDDVQSLAFSGDAAFLAFRRLPEKPASGPFSVASIAAGFRSVFADPRAKICFGSVILEGIFIHGLFPYVALMLLASGETSASIAGLVIGGFGLGGVIYSVSVPALIGNFSERRLMSAGGVLAALMLILVALDFVWYVQVGVFLVLGFGFYLMHGCIHVHVTELSQTARGAATSLHSATFYLGQAAGPVFYGFTFAHGLGSVSIVLGATVVLGVGLTCARYLRHNPEATHSH
jgi:predicted MFS family arabinose efflux permease